MLFVCSSDSTLYTRLARLFKKQYRIKQAETLEKPNLLKAGAKDILIIDLETCKEKDLPEIICPSMALAAVPVKDQAMRLLKKGIRAYGNRFMHEDNLVQAITVLTAGQIWLPPAIVKQMIQALPAAGRKKEQPLLGNLTEREIEVARWVAKGLSNQEISEEMFVSTRTVKAHLTAIFKKTGCRDRLELATRMK